MNICLQTKDINRADFSLMPNGSYLSIYPLPQVAAGGEEISEKSFAENFLKPAVLFSGIWHIIKEGDTLYASSLKYNTTAAKIYSLNRLKATSILKV